MNQTVHESAGDAERIHRLLNELAAVASSDDVLLDKLGDIELAIRRTLDVQSCSVWLTERGEGFAARNTESFRTRRDTGPLGRFMTGDDEFFFTDDYLHDPRISQFSPEAQNYRMVLSRSKSYTPGDTVPQAYVRILSNAATLGVMVITRKSGERWSDRDKWWLRHMAGIVAHLIASDRLLDQVRRSQKQERVHELLLLLLPVASSAMPFQKKVAEIQRMFCDILPVSSVRIWLRKGEEGYAATEPDGFRLDDRSGPLGRFMFDENEFFWTKDYFNDSRIDRDSREVACYRESIAKNESYEPGEPVPQAYVKIRSGEETLGVLVCAPRAGAEFSANDEWWLRHVASMLALVIQNQRLVEQNGGV